jgi:DNA helicase-2/ATP-dependent DNA helicase PcrA
VTAASRAFTPTDEQRAIVASRATTVLVRANAGAAKTTTLALRMADALQQGVPPAQVWALTCTEPAVEALQGALRHVGVPATVLRRLPVLSIEALSERVLRVAEGDSVPRRQADEDVAPVVRAALQELGRAEEPGGIEQFLRLAQWLKGTLALDETAWAHGADAVPLAETADQLDLPVDELRLFRAYEDLRYPARDGIDRPFFRFGQDATYDLARSLRDPDSPTPLHELQGLPRGVSLLVVDELHDLNAAAHAVLVALLEANPQAVFCGVGDEDQVVHGASGADVRYLDPSRTLAGRPVTVLPLTASHRFAAPLAAVAHRIARKPYASAAAHRTTVQCLDVAGDDAAQARALVDAIVTESRQSRRPLSDVAILLRHPHQSIAVENALVEQGLDYRTRGLVPYVRQPEVLLVRALLAVASGRYDALRSRETREALVRSAVLFCGVELGFETDDDESPEARLAVAVRTIQADADMLRPFVEHQLIRLSEPARARAMTRAIAVARDALAAPPAQAGTAPDAWFTRMLDALELGTWVRQVFVRRERQALALAYLDGLRDAVAQHGTPAAFFDRLAQLESRLEEGLDATQSGQKRALRRAVDQRSTLTLAGVADVKGLEFGHVLIPFVEQGRFPDPSADDARQERNLFYVGLTRARSRLTLLARAGRTSSFWNTAAGR